MKLNPKELCPIHRRRDCCGREAFVKRERASSRWEQVRPGVRRRRDEHADHPDGYRYKLSPAEMQKVLARKVREQDGKCYWCHEDFTDAREIDPDHLKPKGLGGARRDDRESNIVAACRGCNSKKGSRRDFAAPKK